MIRAQSGFRAIASTARSESNLSHKKRFQIIFQKPGKGNVLRTERRRAANQSTVIAQKLQGERQPSRIKAAQTWRAFTFYRMAIRVRLSFNPRRTPGKRGWLRIGTQQQESGTLDLLRSALVPGLPARQWLSPCCDGTGFFAAALILPDCEKGWVILPLDLSNLSLFRLAEDPGLSAFQ